MERVHDANRPPFNSIGVLQVTFSDGDRGWGTGALIDSTTVLTCSHNLTRKGDDPPRAVEIHFFPAWNQTPFPPFLPADGITAQCAMASDRYRGGEDDWDIGLVKLTAPVDLLYYMVPAVTNDQRLLHEDLDITGYPGDEQGEMWSDTDQVEKINIDLNTLLFVVGTAKGSSGSPIHKYNADHDTTFQFAVHVAPTDAHALKRAILITPAIHDWLSNAKATPCDGEFLHYL